MQGDVSADTARVPESNAGLGCGLPRSYIFWCLHTTKMCCATYSWKTVVVLKTDPLFVVYLERTRGDVVGGRRDVPKGVLRSCAQTLTL